MVTILLCLLAIAAVYAIGIRSHVSVLRDRLARADGELDGAEHRIGELEANEERTRAALGRLLGPDAKDNLDMCMWASELGAVEIREEEL